MRGGNLRDRSFAAHRTIASISHNLSYLFLYFLINYDFLVQENALFQEIKYRFLSCDACDDLTFSQLVAIDLGFS
jgi:hypothetical protein